jgi:hypothetical protein
MAGEEFVNFMRENSDAIPCSAFFVVDRENSKVSQDKQHFDYFIPSENKMYSFSIENGVKKMPVEMFGEAEPKKIALNYELDFNDVEKIIEERMVEEKIGGKITKLLYSMQHLEGKDYLVGTVFLSMLGMLKVHYDIVDKKIVLFEKKSFMDMIKVSGKGKKEE